MPKKTATDKAVDFESAMSRLSVITEQLESDSTALDESLKLFEEGMALVKTCESKLKSAEMVIEKVSQNNTDNADDI